MIYKKTPDYEIKVIEFFEGYENLKNFFGGEDIEDDAYRMLDKGIDQ
jgi:hypothetical protein